jgi:hypothetical protein
VQREVNVVDDDLVILLQLFNTPGTEIAPRSNEVGIYVENDWLGHIYLSYKGKMGHGLDGRHGYKEKIRPIRLFRVQLG